MASLSCRVLQAGSTLSCVQNMEHKFVELLAADFRAAPREMVQQMVEYRYKALQSKLALTQASLADVYALVRLLRTCKPPWSQQLGLPIIRSSTAPHSFHTRKDKC